MRKAEKPQVLKNIFDSNLRGEDFEPQFTSQSKNIGLIEKNHDHEIRIR